MRASKGACLGAICVCAGVVDASKAPKLSHSIAAFDWNSIEPSHDLEYHDCYGEFQCARLVLPLDWLDKTRNETVTIAITKLPAVVDETDETFGGTIVSQPGGPGVSGTMYGVGRSSKIRDILDIPEKRHYEIVSFDTRGTGQSTPKINCYPGDLYYTRIMTQVANGALDLHSKALSLLVAQAKADAVRCERAHGDFLSYVSTADVVRDMVRIIDRVDEMRRRNIVQQSSGDDSARLELRSERNAMELPRIQYIGISYGTILGNVFASMFPERVGRMALDGVCDIHDWVDDGFMTNTDLVDEIVDRFFQGCFESGITKCPLIQGPDNSGTDISRRVWDWAAELDDYPLTTIKDDGDVLFIRSGEIRNVFRWNMYNANSLSRPMAEMLNDAMNGNATQLFQTIAEFYEVDQLHKPHRNSVIPQDAAAAIACSDAADVSNYTLSDWRHYLDRQLSISTIAGAAWAAVRIACAGWKTRPKWPYTGPFGTPPPSKLPESPEPDRPAAPLLFMSNTYDPATPLRNARAMRKLHPKSGLLIHESTGHCVTSGPIGPCAKTAMSTYFATGQVPSEELVCSDTCGPWDDDNDDSILNG